MENFSSYITPFWKVSDYVCIRIIADFINLHNFSIWLSHGRKDTLQKVAYEMAKGENDTQRGIYTNYIWPINLILSYEKFKF